MIQIRKTLLASAFVLAVALNSGWAQEASADGEAGAQSLLSIESATRDHIFGEEDAPVTIVEYASFTCPHCMDFEEEVWPKIQEKYVEEGKARLIYREVYFDGAGLLAATLARCVPEEQYYPMVFTLYDTNETWLKSQSNVEGIVGELTKLGLMAGLGKDQIAACFDNRDAQEAMIANTQMNMQKDNVSGTPTLIVNGETVTSWQWEELEPFLDKKLEEAEAAQ